MGCPQAGAGRHYLPPLLWLPVTYGLDDRIPSLSFHHDVEATVSEYEIQRDGIPHADHPNDCGVVGFESGEFDPLDARRCRGRMREVLVHQVLANVAVTLGLAQLARGRTHFWKYFRDNRNTHKPTLLVVLFFSALESRNEWQGISFSRVGTTSG